MRPSLVLSLFFVFATACTFGEVDVKKPAVDDPYAERTKHTTSIGEGVDEKALQSQKLTTIACGYDIACEPGIGCCVTANGPSCTNSCAQGTHFTCLSAADCGSGQECIFDGHRAICRSAGSGLRLCKDGAECGDGFTCSQETCGGVYGSAATCRPAGQESRQLSCGPNGEDGVGIETRDENGSANPDPGPTPWPSP
jgi:hypothetical protein